MINIVFRRIKNRYILISFRRKFNTYSWGEQSNYIQATSDVKTSTPSARSEYQTYGFNWFDKSENKWKTSFQSTATTPEITTIESKNLYYSPSFLGRSSNEYRTLFCNKAGNQTAYWLANSYEAPDSNWVHYGLYIIWTNGYVFMDYIYTSYGTVDQDNLGIRPVVSLKSNIKLEYDDENSYYDII